MIFVILDVRNIGWELGRGVNSKLRGESVEKCIGFGLDTQTY